MNKEKNKLKIIGICGSLREGSYTKTSLEIALQGASEIGVKTKCLDLNNYDLGYCHGDEDFDYPDDVFKLRDEVKNAHGIILGTPEYHGSISGVLKNSLDLMGFNEFEGKLIGLVGVSGGAMGAMNALNSLRNIGRSLHAWVVPDQVSIPSAWQKFDSTGKIKDANLENRLKEVGRQVAKFAVLHNSKQAMEFLKIWEEAPKNPGADEK